MGTATLCYRWGEGPRCPGGLPEVREQVGAWPGLTPGSQPSGRVFLLPPHAFGTPAPPALVTQAGGSDVFTGGHEGSAAQGSGDVVGQTPRAGTVGRLQTRNGVDCCWRRTLAVGSSVLTLTSQTRVSLETGWVCCQPFKGFPQYREPPLAKVSCLPG